MKKILIILMTFSYCGGFSQSIKEDYLGIGMVIDSATDLSRSFNLFEVFKTNPVSGTEGNLKAILVDYPLNASFAITGTILANNAKIKIYRKGVKIDEFVCGKQWKEIYQKITARLHDFGYKPAKKFKNITEGASLKLNERFVERNFPGSATLSVPYSNVIDTFRHYATISSYKNTDLYKTVAQVYGQFANVNENKLFFFRNDNVPYGLKDVARPLIFPVHRSLNPALIYLSCGSTFYSKNDVYAAYNCYTSALFAGRRLLTSPYEKSLLRSIAFRGMSQIHATSSPGRMESAKLFQLAADMHSYYLRSGLAQEELNRYYEGIQKISSICTGAEAKAREIRGTKRLGGLLAAISYAGSLSSVNAYDNTASDALLQQAQLTLEQSFSQAQEASELLMDQFSDIEQKIQSETFVAPDGSPMEIGKSFVAGEVFYFLSYKPDLVKDLLLNYAADKAKLKNLLLSFYANPEQKTLLNEIFVKVAEIEGVTVNAEMRKIKLSSTLTANF